MLKFRVQSCMKWCTNGRHEQGAVIRMLVPAVLQPANMTAHNISDRKDAQTIHIETDLKFKREILQQTGS